LETKIKKMTLLEQQVEFNRCASDPVYFINKYWVKKKYSPLLADFKLYNYQEDLIANLVEGKEVVINSSRQMGIDTVVGGYILWKSVFTPGHKTLLKNARLTTAFRSLQMIRDTASQLPIYLTGVITIDNKRKLVLANNSTIDCITGEGEYRGGGPIDVDLLWENEASFCQSSILKQEGFARVLRKSKSFQRIVSSCLGKRNWFTDLCFEGEMNLIDGRKIPYTYVKLPYYLHPRRDRLWRSNQEKMVGVNAAVVEYDCTHFFSEDSKTIIPFIQWPKT
jgi:hypothetical protein